MIIKRRRSLLSLFFILLLAACSPHPGSGIWLSVDDTGPYGKLAILFEGQAELYPVGRKAYRYRCFWAGLSADSLRMDCVSADDPAQKARFEFRVLADGSGELLESGRSLGHFHRTDEKPTRQ